MTKSILITGINGFVGKNLTTYLSQFEYSISGISRIRKQNDPAITYNFNWEELHLLKDYSFNTMIHLAGKAHDLKKTANDEEYFTINTEITKSLFDIFLQSKAETFIYFSSVKAATDRVENILEEELLPNPQTAYGKSKLRAEEYLLTQNLPPGKRVIIVRPCMIHGPGNKGNLNLLYQFVRKGIPYPLAAFENRRSFLSIDNLCFVIKALIEEDSISSGIYNLADDESLSTNEVVRTISETLHKKPRFLAIPRFILRTIANIGDVIKLPLNSERLNKLTENYVVSNKKIKNALHIDYLPFPSRVGLRKTIGSFGSIKS